ncbi:unnamed protein product, partial [marine sediment metagenome]
ALGSSIAFAEDMSGYGFDGFNWNLDLSDENANSMVVQGASVSGLLTSSGAPGFIQCRLVDESTLPSGGYLRCTLPGDLHLNGTYYMFDNCSSAVAGTSAPSFSAENAGATSLNFRHHSGGIEIKSLKAGDTVSVEGDGQIIINADCTGGTIAVRGHFPISGDATAIGNIVWADDARFDVDQITLATAAALAAGDIATSTKQDTMETTVDAILADTGTDGVVLSGATMNSIAAALLDLTDGIETSWTLKQVLRIIASACGGILSGAGTTE